MNVSPFMRRYFILYGLTLGLKQKNTRNLKIVVFSLLQKRQKKDLSALSNIWNKRTIFVKIIWCHEILADFPNIFVYANIFAKIYVFLKVSAKICVTQEQFRGAVETFAVFPKSAFIFTQNFRKNRKSRKN